MTAGARLLLATDAVGGVWQYSLELARGLAAHGTETVLALMGPAPSGGQRAAAEGLRLVETGLPLDWLADEPASVARTGEALAKIARREGADIVQVNSAALVAEAGFDVPAVVVQHSCVASWWAAVRGTKLPPDFCWRTELVRKGLRAADAVVAPSRAFAKATARLYGLEAVAAVHNGRTARPLGTSAPDDCVFTAGRLWDEGKDLATLDAAAARLPVPVLAAGPIVGPHGAAIDLRAVHPLGELDDVGVAAHLSRRPVFVSTALYEPFGLAVLEAAAAGCPLVLSDIPTFRELWDGAALFVSPRDAEAFAKTLGELVGDDFHRDALGKAAIERAARYTPERMAAGMAAIHAGLLATPARPAFNLAGAA